MDFYFDCMKSSLRINRSAFTLEISWGQGCMGWSLYLKSETFTPPSTESSLVNGLLCIYYINSEKLALFGLDLFWSMKRWLLLPIPRPMNLDRVLFDDTDLAWASYVGGIKTSSKTVESLVWICWLMINGRALDLHLCYWLVSALLQKVFKPS